jgi:hypothetical protein
LQTARLFSGIREPPFCNDVTAVTIFLTFVVRGPAIGDHHDEGERSRYWSAFLDRPGPDRGC